MILAAYTWSSSGLRAPAVIAIVKDVMLYTMVARRASSGSPSSSAATPTSSSSPTGPSKPPRTRQRPSISHRASSFGYSTLAIGSAIALMLYPHTATAVLSALLRQHGPPQRRHAPRLQLPARPHRPARLRRPCRRHLHRRRQTPAPPSPCSSSRCFPSGSPASASPPSPSARSSPRPSCPSPPPTSSPAIYGESSAAPP